MQAVLLRLSGPAGCMESRLPRAGTAEILSARPQVSCCYWVPGRPTIPCMASVILSSIKHQAPGSEPQAPRPQPASRRPPEAQRPWNWAVWPCRQATGSHLVFVSPHRIDTVLTNSTSASTPLHPERSQKEGRRQASLRLPPSPTSIPPTSTQCDQSVQSSRILPLVLTSCVLCQRLSGSQRKGNF